MKTLYLLRHAHAPSMPELRDRDRPLDGEGRAGAAAVAERMGAGDMRPGLVLCSAALRTRQTLEPVLALWPDLTVHYEEDLYLAETGALYEKIKAIPDEYESALLIGHNPGIHGLALFLSGTGESGLRTKIAGGYPVACLATLSFPDQKWAEILPGGGRLEDLTLGE